MNSPFRYRSAFTVPFQYSTGSAVVRLFGARGPSAISLRVITIVIHALQRVQRRRLGADVREERDEIVTPTIAHANPAPAVVWIRRHLWAVAAILHRGPHQVLAATGQSMFRRACAVPFGAKTAAAFGSSASQARDHGIDLGAALAPATNPQTRRRACGGRTDHSETVELLAQHFTMISQAGVRAYA